MLSRVQQFAIASVAIAAMALPASEAADPGDIPDRVNASTAASFGQGPNNSHPPVNADIVDTPVDADFASTSNVTSIPEATTMILLGTALLAAFRARRQPSSDDPLATGAPTPDRRSTPRHGRRRSRC